VRRGAKERLPKKKKTPQHTPKNNKTTPHQTRTKTQAREKGGDSETGQQGDVLVGTGNQWEESNTKRGWRKRARGRDNGKKRDHENLENKGKLAGRFQVSLQALLGC